jgi:hypothetical protein
MNLSLAALLLLTATAAVDGFSTSRMSRSSRIPAKLFADASASVVLPSKTALSMRSKESSNIGSKTSSLNAATVVEESPKQETQETTTTTTTSVAAKSYLDDGFVFGLDGSGLGRPKGKEAVVVVEGDDLETQTWQVAFVSATFLGLAGFATTAFLEMLQVNHGDLAWTTLQSVLLFASSWVFADLGSGVLHWSVDNYGNGRTPIMGGIIAAFQGHHSAPWTITQRGFFNNVSKLCIPFGVVTMSILSAITGPSMTFFFTLFCAFEILSQEFHKWSHTTKSQVPEWVNKIQSMGLSIGRKPHAQHHFAPYDGNYCIVSGFCNPLLDNSGIFRRLEHVVFNLNGIESNAWKLDPELKQRTLSGKYQPLKKRVN